MRSVFLGFYVVILIIFREGMCAFLRMVGDMLCRVDGGLTVFLLAWYSNGRLGRLCKGFVSFHRHVERDGCI